MLLIRIKKLRDNVHLPSFATEGSAGFDLYACCDHDVLVDVGQTVAFPLGFATSFEKKFLDGSFVPYALLTSRSGLACKKGIVVANAPGIIDNDYRGEWVIYLRNLSKQPYIVKHADRIAQAIIGITQHSVGFTQVSILDETERGIGGFGSTGD